MKKDYITEQIEGGERRFFSVDIELREAGENKRTIRGYAALFENDSEDFGYFVERIAPGAFDDVLKDDVVALFNHDPNLPLARTGAGLQIGVDKKGLWYEFDAPETTIGNDLLVNIRQRIVRQSSFAFTVADQAWLEEEGKKTVRLINKLKRLYDVSPVTYPAYADTTVAIRSFEKERPKEPSKLAIIQRKLRLQKLAL
jgi:hypothetical protein